MTSKYSLKSHKHFLKYARVNCIDFCSDLKVFDAAVKNIIINFQKTIDESNIPIKKKHYTNFGNYKFLDSGSQKEWGEDIFKEKPSVKLIFDNSLNWGEVCLVSKGMVLNSCEKRWKNEFKKSDIISDLQTEINSKKYVEAKWIKKYFVEKAKYLEWNTQRVPNKVSRKTYPELYLPNKIMQGGMTGAIFDNEQLLCNHSIYVSVLWMDLTNVHNRSIKMNVRKDFSVSDVKVGAKRKELENNSKQFDLKYLLSILNSKFGFWCLSQVRRSQIGFYPDDLKKLPIKIIEKRDQQPFITLVNQIVTAKKANPQADTSVLEREIDLLVYELYGLTEEEIAIVEESTQ